MSIKHELQDLIQGKGGGRKTNFSTPIADLHRAGKEAGAGNEGKECTKQEEELERLISYTLSNFTVVPSATDTYPHMPPAASPALQLFLLPLL